MEMSRTMSRFLALAILAAIVALLWLFVVWPITAKFDAYDESMVQSEELLARYLRVSGTRADLEAALAEARRDQAAVSGFLKGASVQLVAADLQNTLKRLINANGGELNSIQMLPQEAENGFHQVAMRVVMTGDTETLRRVIYAIETANPYLFLDNLDIRAQRKRTQKNENQSAEVLQVRYDVYGYMPAGAS
jgi:general secretion pathway protein M